jgi:hypothetical protein
MLAGSDFVLSHCISAMAMTGQHSQVVSSAITEILPSLLLDKELNPGETHPPGGEAGEQRGGAEEAVHGDISR